MDAVNFAYWLNGFAELHGDTPPTKAQWKAIREHLELAFKKVTPPVGVPGTPQKLSSLDWLRLPQCSSAGNPLAGQVQSVC